MIRRRRLVRAAPDGFVVALEPDEAALVVRLVGELRVLLTDPSPDSATLVARLFPVAHHDDEQAEAEYQRLMRDELVASKMAAFDIVEQMLTDDASAPVDEAQLTAFMQSVNSLRLVLGTMLDVTDDPEQDEVVDELDESPEYQLYTYLSVLLEHTVRALSGD